MKILTIGASSYVGARIYLDLKDDYNVIGTYHNNPLSKSFIKLDITDKEEVLKKCKEVKPDVIIHLANFTSFNKAVHNEEIYSKLNGKATGYIVDAANAVGAKLIFVSSQAANNPSTVYGQLKVRSEKLVKSVHAGYIIVRPSFIVGLSPNTGNCKQFNSMLKCLDHKESGEFDISWKLQPTYIGHLSQVIKKVIETDIRDTVIPVFIDEIVTQYQIAHDILSKFGVEVKQIDKHIDILPSKDDLSLFNSFHLFPYTYKDMIEVIIREIQNKEAYRI
ncbi:MAG: sugar nucleotide-binding protein [Patescibacteria group bacterium]